MTKQILRPIAATGKSKMSFRELKLAEYEADSYELGKVPWPQVWNTPLSRYSSQLMLKLGDMLVDFEVYLTAKSIERELEGKILRVLDVGVGTGRQWIAFLSAHPNVEFHATALLEETINPALRDKVKVCGASAILAEYPLEYFDIISSHHGMHHSEVDALKSIWKLLVGDGEAIVVGDSFNYNMPSGIMLRRQCPFFEVLGEDTGSTTNVAYHLRKKSAW